MTTPNDGGPAFPTPSGTARIKAFFAYKNGPHDEAIADRAYAMADAMLKARTA